MAGFFRELSFPSHAQDYAAHERFQLDTLADRRAEETPRVASRAWFRAVVTRAMR